MKVCLTIPFPTSSSQYTSLGPNQWPPENDTPDFREKMDVLFERYKELNHQLNKHICQLLAIPEDVLNDFFPEKTEFNSAIWHYFPITPERLQEIKDGFVQGMHAHRDPSTFLTCLIQNRAGLQVQNHAGDWIDIPMVEGGVVCNVGEPQGLALTMHIILTRY